MILDFCNNNSPIPFKHMLKSYNIEGRTVHEEKLLSEGGYGYILKAVDIRTREVFALKKSYCQGEERTKVAQNEMQIMRRLPKHQNIVNFIAGTFVQENGQQLCLILMEFCNGGSLFDLMAKDPNARFPEDQIVGFIKEITQGIKAMHMMNPPMAHRDIKIENVLFQNGVCKLCDFGSVSSQRLDFSQIQQRDFAQYEENFEKNTTLMYRPPEMADLFLRYEVNEKVDVWMLGCVLFTLCFFVHPFQESSKLAISTATYKIPRDSRYSEKLKDFIRLMLTPNPKLRPSIFDVERILYNFQMIREIPLNLQAIEIKNRDAKLEKEMEEFNKNSHKVKKFDGDIPMEELLKLQNKIKQDQQSTQVSKPQPRYNSNQQIIKSNSVKMDPPTQQPQLFRDFSNNQSQFGQQKSNQFWDAFTAGQQQQQINQDTSTQFNFGFVSSQSQSPNPFGWDSFPQVSPVPVYQQYQPQPQQIQQLPQQQQQITQYSPSSTNTSGWENSASISEYSQASTQPSMQFWPIQQSMQQQIPPQVFDLIGLEESQPAQQPEKIDLSNVQL